jgi:FkbM family methyltransferase
MIVSTRYLFAALLKPLAIDTVGDVGSMDGTDTLYFRRASGGARCYAFEPNPDNYRRMTNDARLIASDIHIVPLAASDHDGSAPFFLVPANDSLPRDQRGMSSLYLREQVEFRQGQIVVGTTRLDTFFEREEKHAARLALWIDVEGMAAEVVAGMRGIAAAVCLIHVEAETLACIGRDQKLYGDVARALNDMGFTEIATDRRVNELQLNAVFVRRDVATEHAGAIRLLLLRAWLRRRLAKLAYALFPSLVRRLSGRARARR